jgi:regulator of sigma E protease
VTLDGIFFWAVAILATLIVLGSLVVVHELGHFVTARLVGIRVLEFGIGFPPRAKVIGHDHETEYTLNYLPIGGFVRLEGEESDSDDPRAFGNASLGKQLLVLVAGVTMNVVTAFLLFFLVAWAFNPVVRPHVTAVVDGSPAALAGIKAGESLTSIDGKSYSLIDLGGDPWAAFQSYLASRAGQPVTLGVVDAAGHERNVQVTLRVPDAAHAYALGVQFSFGVAYMQGDPVTALGTSVTSTGKAMSLIVVALGDLGTHIATSPTTGPPGVSGPVGIAAVVGHTLFDYGPILLLLLAAVISANLALLNILPIPPFDGGKMAIMVIKRVFRIHDVTRLESAIYLVGFALLMAFLVWISYFDLLGLGSHG